MQSLINLEMTSNLIFREYRSVINHSIILNNTQKDSNFKVIREFNFKISSFNFLIDLTFIDALISFICSYQSSIK